MTTIRLLTEEMIILTEEDMEDITNSINNKILSTKITTSTANNSNLAAMAVATNKTTWVTNKTTNMEEETRWTIIKDKPKCTTTKVVTNNKTPLFLKAPNQLTMEAWPTLITTTAEAVSKVITTREEATKKLVTTTQWEVTKLQLVSNSTKRRLLEPPTTMGFQWVTPQEMNLRTGMLLLAMILKRTGIKSKMYRLAVGLNWAWTLNPSNLLYLAVLLHLHQQQQTLLPSTWKSMVLKTRRRLKNTRNTLLSSKSALIHLLESFLLIFSERLEALSFAKLILASAWTGFTWKELLKTSNQLLDSKRVASLTEATKVELTKAVAMISLWALRSNTTTGETQHPAVGTKLIPRSSLSLKRKLRSTKIN